MTITEFLNLMWSAYTMEQVAGFSDKTYIWSMCAAQGYCIKAMQKCGYSRKQIIEVVKEMALAKDTMTYPDAEWEMIDFSRGRLKTAISRIFGRRS